MSSEPSGSMVVDTGVLLELATDSPLARRFGGDVIGGRVRPITGELNVMELGYIICRRAGIEEAARIVGYLRRASQFRILPPSEFLDAAARIKCTRRLSVVDCITVAMAESLGAPVLFARRERELTHEISKSPFKTRVLFLGDQ